MSSGQKPHLTKQGKKILCKTEKFRTSRCPWIVVKFWYQFHRRTDQVDLQVQHKNEVTIRRPETPKTQKTHKKRDNNGASGDRLRDLLEWSEEFTETLEDTEVPAFPHISHDSYSERPTKVEVRKMHSSRFDISSLTNACQAAWQSAHHLISSHLTRESLFQGKRQKMGSNHTVKFSRSTWHQIKFGKERVHRKELFKSVNLMSAVPARPGLRRGHKRKPCTKKDAPAQ